MSNIMCANECGNDVEYPLCGACEAALDAKSVEETTALRAEVTRLRAERDAAYSDGVTAAETRLKADLAASDDGRAALWEHLSKTKADLATAREELAATRDGMNGYLHAAREEQREAGALNLDILVTIFAGDDDKDALRGAARTIRATPLDSTPLADRLAEQRASIVAMCEQAAAGALDRAEKAEAERDEFENLANVTQDELNAERLRHLATTTELAALRGPHTGNDWIRIYDERRALKAQVERLTEALGNLVAWGRWARKRAGVAMNTPHSGALTAAEDLLNPENP